MVTSSSTCRQRALVPHQHRLESLEPVLDVRRLVHRLDEEQARVRRSHRVSQVVESAQPDDRINLQDPVEHYGSVVSDGRAVGLEHEPLLVVPANEDLNWRVAVDRFALTVDAGSLPHHRPLIPVHRLQTRHADPYLQRTPLTRSIISSRFLAPLRSISSSSASRWMSLTDIESSRVGSKRLAFCTTGLPF